jgi:hypothetical protein
VVDLKCVEACKLVWLSALEYAVVVYTWLVSQGDEADAENEQT